MGLAEWWRKRIVSKEILKAGMHVRELETDNTRIVKQKLLLYKKLARNELDQETTQLLIFGIEWQKQLFTSLSDFSYGIDKYTEDTDLDERTRPIRQKLIEARNIIDFLIAIYDSQLNILRSLNGEKRKRLRELIIAELKIYERYQKLKKTVPAETLAHIEVELEELKRHPLIAGDRAFISYPIAAALMIGFMYLSFDDTRIKETIMKPECLPYLAILGIAYTKIEVEFKKLRRGSQLAKALSQ